MYGGPGGFRRRGPPAGFPWMGPLRHFLIGVDFEENEKDLTLSVPLPGVAKEDIDLSVGPDAVVITLKDKETTDKSKMEEKEEDYDFAWPLNLGRGFFKTRRYPLPAEVDPETAKAKLENGMLRITIEKKNPGKKIEVE
jgi:HSP20 family protein